MADLSPPSSGGRFQLARLLAARFGRLSPVTQGAAYMTLAALFFALMNTFVRFVSDAGVDATQIAFFRNFFALVFMLPWLLRTRFAGGRTKRLFAHVWRGIVGLGAMNLWFLSIAVLPLAQATALNFTFPLFGTILAALVLKETVRLRRWSATLVGFLGVLVILQPWSTGVSWAALLPVAAAAFMAVSSVLVKSLSSTEKPATMVFYMNLIMTPLSLIPAAFYWVWPDLETWLWAAALGFFAAISHIMLTRAYVLADASVVQPFDYLRLPFIALIGYLLFGEVPDQWLWIGAAIIAASTFYIARREAQLARPLRSAKAPENTP